MYFQAFRREAPPAIPQEVMFTVEYLVSQILTTADRAFLQAALEQRRLAEALFEELDFFGQVPRRYMPEVKTYLITREGPLREVAQRIVEEPDNKALREQLCHPVSL